MKKLIYLLVFGCSFGFAQNVKVKFSNNVSSKKTLFKNLNLKFEPIEFVKNSNVAFYQYNQTTGNTDKFITIGNEFYLSNRSNFYFDKRDSFNPNGATNLGTALGFGLLNLLIQKN
jgi:hypothetical protein